MNLELVFEPFQYAFMVRAFLGVSLVALVAAAVGTFVVLKGLAFMGDAIAHTAFTGIALGSAHRRYPPECAGVRTLHSSRSSCPDAYQG